MLNIQTAENLVEVPQLQVIDGSQEHVKKGSDNTGDATRSEVRGGTDEFQNVRRLRLRERRACTTLGPYLKGRTDKDGVQKDQTSVHKCEAKCKEPREKSVQVKRLTMNSRERQPMKYGARRAESEKESEKAAPDKKTGRSLHTCLSRGVLADHEAQSQVKEERRSSCRSSESFLSRPSCGKLPHWHRSSNFPVAEYYTTVLE